jgi:hypothetical protein
MARQRIYSSPAARQKAYRERTKLGQACPQPTASQRKPRAPSRPKRLKAIERELSALATEYQDWLDRIPEGLDGSDLADLLSQTIDQLGEASEIIANITVPRGFGRD